MYNISSHHLRYIQFSFCPHIRKCNQEAYPLQVLHGEFSLTPNYILSIPSWACFPEKKKNKKMQSTYYKLNSHILLICVTRTLTWWGCKSDIVYLTLVLPYHIFVTIKSGVKALQLNDFKDLIRKGVWGNTKEDG